ncbi:tail-anchored protein insertion receptor, partial [Lecanoromycetidae sp. Uapishka_2]
MVNISTLKTILFTVGPLLIPKLISWYRTQKVQVKTAPVSRQPVPKPIYKSFNILFISALLALISTLPYFAPENIFTITQSRLQTPNDVLFTRLALARDGGLTDDDNTLRPKIASLDSRLLYFTYGPNVLTHCPFCISDEPMTYFYYALPSIAIPHILHTFALGLATSTAVAGNYGNRWRGLAAVLGLGLAASEMWLFGSYDWKANARKFRAEDCVHWYWRMRIFRGVLVAMADAVFAGLLWLSSTNRMFVIPPSAAERTEMAMRTLEQARGKLNAVAIMRNVVSRDEGLRRKSEAYWKQEGQVMGEVMDEREVVESVRNALDGRLHVVTIEEDARKYAEGITGWQDHSQVNGAPIR